MGTLSYSENVLHISHCAELDSLSNSSPVILKYLFNIAFSDTFHSYFLTFKM